MGDRESRAFDVEWEAQFAPEPWRWVTCPVCEVDYRDDDECPCSRDA